MLRSSTRRSRRGFRPPATRWHGLLAAVAVLAAWTVSWPSSQADDTAGSAFVPAEISVGDPIVLPPPSAASAAAGAPPTARAAVPGNGWVGLSVAESNTPGRWVVDEVAPTGPAAGVGIRLGDEIRAINGTILRSRDDVAQALTVLAPGQAVSMAVGRGEAIADVRLTAVERPVPDGARGWRGTSADPGETAGLGAAEDLRMAAVPAIPDTAGSPRGAAATPSRAYAAAPASGFTPAMPVAPTVPAASIVVDPVAPAELPPPVVAAAAGRTALGVRTVPLDPETRSRFRLPAPQGAYVIGVVQDLPAARAGLPPGSVIVALDERPVGSPEELTRLVTGGPVGRPVSLQYVLPGGEARRTEVVLQRLEVPLERALIGLGEPAATGHPALVPSPAPTADPLPYRANSAGDAAADDAMRVEIRRLRHRLDELERRLPGPATGHR